MKTSATVVFVILVALILAGCVAPQAAPPASPTPELPATATFAPPAPSATATSVPATPAPSPTPPDAETDAPTPWPTTASVTTGDFPCDLTRWVAPTPPPVSYSFGELDPTTGLHVTGNAQVIDPLTYRLEITGTVATPLLLTLDYIRCLPRQEIHCTLVCPDTFVDSATWAGPRLWDVLALAGLPEEISSIRLVGADGYGTWIPVSLAQADDSLLAYEWQGEPLPILHGFPLRGVFPESPGYMWVKWLVRIEIQ